MTKEENIQNILEYVGLDLENIPTFLSYKEISFESIKTLEDTNVFKYVPVDKIQILITPKNRLDSTIEKYETAMPIIKYLSTENPENIERYSMFLSMLDKTNVNNIKKEEEIQKRLESEPPFDIKYEKSFAWQIYYSQEMDMYYTLITSGDTDYEKLFLLLKMQIEYYKNPTVANVPKIFVPVSHVTNKNKLLKKSELADIENHLWLFTKEWPSIYEVYDKFNQYSICIIGEAQVYKNVKSIYKVELTTEKQAMNFYNHIKALFLLQTELQKHYKFKIVVNHLNTVEFYNNDYKLDYESLFEFIKSECLRVDSKMDESKKKVAETNLKVENLKKMLRDKEAEYLEKQKEISTYLEYRKTFFGKVKLFFKRKKAIKEEVVADSVSNQGSKEEVDIGSEETSNVKNKKYFTIEDLVVISYKFDKEDQELKNNLNDIEASELKLKNLESKIKNATLYINEIEDHKKSIFEFWKFANKDEIQMIQAGEDVVVNETKIKKVFDYELDFENLGTKMDNEQRNKLSKEEQNSIYLFGTNVGEAISGLENKEIPKRVLKELKEEAKIDTETEEMENYNIFGSMQENKDSIKTLGNKRHREVMRNKFQILELDGKTLLSEFKEKLKESNKYIISAFDKIKSIYDMSVYVAKPLNESINSGYEKYFINPETALEAMKDYKGELALYKINVAVGTPILFYSNIIYFDNYNKTLPVGMNLSNLVLLNNNLQDIKLVDKQEIRTNKYTSYNVPTPFNRKIYVYEYDM